MDNSKENDSDGKVSSLEIEKIFDSIKNGISYLRI